jgi:hypothetical protein
MIRGKRGGAVRKADGTAGTPPRQEINDVDQ